MARVVMGAIAAALVVAACSAGPPSAPETDPAPGAVTTAPALAPSVPSAIISTPPVSGEAVAVIDDLDCVDPVCSPAERQWLRVLGAAIDAQVAAGAACFGDCRQMACEPGASPFYLVTREGAVCADEARGARAMAHAMIVNSHAFGERRVITFEVRSAEWGRPSGNPAMPVAFVVERPGEAPRLLGVAPYVTRWPREDGMEGGPPEIYIEWPGSDEWPTVRVADRYGFAGAGRQEEVWTFRFLAGRSRWEATCQSAKFDPDGAPLPAEPTDCRPSWE